MLDSRHYHFGKPVVAVPARQHAETPESESSEDQAGSNVLPLKPPSAVQADNNLVKRSVDEICGLLAQSHEARETLLAHGIGFHLLNSIIELGIKGQPGAIDKMLDTAAETSRKEHGSDALSRDQIARQVATVVAFEKDLTHARLLARRQGLHMPALQHLTQLIRQNPGDGGKEAVNTFVTYAIASGIELDRIDELMKRVPEEPASVLPDIERNDADKNTLSLRELGINIGIGLLLALCGLWLVV